MNKNFHLQISRITPIHERSDLRNLRNLRINSLASFSSEDPN